LLYLSGTTFGLGAGIIGNLDSYPAWVRVIVLGLYLSFRKTDTTAKE
jgi:hypothetical protein